MTRWLGKLLGIEDLESIRHMEWDFAAPWAEGRPVLTLFACLVAAALGVLFYTRYQQVAKTGAKIYVATSRALLLALLVLILAEPVVAMVLVEKTKPLLVLLFDGTESMARIDKLGAEEITALRTVLKDKKGAATLNPEEAGRLDLVRAVLANQPEAIEQLSQKFRLRAYVMQNQEGVVQLDIANAPGKTFDLIKALESVKADGDVTALAANLEDLGRREKGRSLAGVVVFSDFAENHGGNPVDAGARLSGTDGGDVPIYTVGVGPTEIVNLVVDFQVPVDVKKDYDSQIQVTLDQTGLAGQTARVRLFAQRSGESGSSEPILVAQRTVELDQAKMTVPLIYRPSSTGHFDLYVQVDPLDDEVFKQDNTSPKRDVYVSDESLKLLFAEYEPSWEWRFVKEVYHRHPLVGREGFRTFLRSADPRVRRSNEFFLQSLIRPRSEFFAYDVIFLGDMPADVLSEPFQDMLYEFVVDFGGGLVVMAGPRFGAGALSRTRIGGMLPVQVDSTSRAKIGDFRMRLTPMARLQPFMKLSENEQDNRKAWANMGKLPWYQEVIRVKSGATVLAEHPTDRMADGRTPQPLIVVHRVGKGEVVYIGFNEMWRLRRKYGEKYYSRFWSQLILKLGWGRTRGAQKRFEVRTNRENYKAGDEVTLTVKAYDGDFKSLPDQKLTGRHAVPVTSGQSAVRDLTVPLSHQSLYETVFRVYEEGKHTVWVLDPVTGQEKSVGFVVAPRAAEMRDPVRNEKIQRELARRTGGNAYELHEFSTLVKNIKVPNKIESLTERRFPLWNTWLMLILVVGVMLGEWLVRKMVNLR